MGGATLGIGKFNEVNVFRPPKKPDHSIALLFPSTYQASLSNLFTHISYHYLSQELPNTVVDRFTLDNKTEGALTRWSLRRFDLILVSVTYELDLISVIDILISNGIPPLRGWRANKNRPIIIGGGPPPTANPLPYIDVFDVVFVGEGESLLKKLPGILESCGRSKNVRSCLTEELGGSEGKGIYLPGAQTVSRAHEENLNYSYIPEANIASLTVKPAYGDGYYIEVSRGCKWLCPFCMESHITYPFRWRERDLIIQAIKEGIQHSLKRRAVLYSLSFFDHPHADKLLNTLIDEGIGYSLPSLRYHTLNRERLELVKLGGQKIVTLAPETGVPSAATTIGKPLKRDLLQSIIHESLLLGLRPKFYFMFGIPEEGDKAGYEAAELLRESLKKYRGREPIKISVNPLIPKAWTPMHYCRMVSKKSFKLKTKQFIEGLKDLKVSVNTYSWTWAYAQGIISLSNTGIGKAITRWRINGGEGIHSLIAVLRKSPGFIDPLKEREEIPGFEVVEDANKALISTRARALCR